MKQGRDNIGEIRQQAGSGPVREEKPATVKKRAAVGPKEAALRALRAEQNR